MNDFGTVLGRFLLNNDRDPMIEFFKNNEVTAFEKELNDVFNVLCQLKPHEIIYQQIQFLYTLKSHYIHFDFDQQTKSNQYILEKIIKNNNKILLKIILDNEGNQNPKVTEEILYQIYLNKDEYFIFSFLRKYCNVQLLKLFLDSNFELPAKQQEFFKNIILKEEEMNQTPMEID